MAAEDNMTHEPKPEPKLKKMNTNMYIQILVEPGLRDQTGGTEGNIIVSIGHFKHRIVINTTSPCQNNWLKLAGEKTSLHGLKGTTTPPFPFSIKLHSVKLPSGMV